MADITTYKRGPHGDGRYTAVPPIRPNSGNWFYDAQIIDNWFLIACMSYNKQLMATTFPIAPLQLTAYPDGVNTFVYDAVGPLPTCP